MTIFQDNAPVRQSTRAGVWRDTTVSFLAALKARLQARRTFNALHGLDDHTLKDIGFDRSEIMSVSYGDRTGRRRF